MSLIAPILVKSPLKWLAGWYLLFILSCQQKQKDSYHEYYDSLVFRVEKALTIKERKAAVDSFESALHRHPYGVIDKCNFYSFKSSLYLLDGDYMTCIIYQDSILLFLKDRLKEPQFNKWYSDALLTKSECYLTLKNYNEAMNQLLYARNIINSTNPGNVCRFYDYNQRVATMLYKQARYGLSIVYFKKTIEDANTCDPSPLRKFAGIQGNLDNIGMAYAEMGMQDSASRYFKTALEYVQTHEHKFPNDSAFMSLAKGVIYGNMAKIKRQQGNYGEAERMSRLAINNTEGVYENTPLAARFELANIYKDWGKLEDAEYILIQVDSAQHFSTQKIADNNTLLWYRAMQELNVSKGNFSRAFHYNAQYLHLRDSLDQTLKMNIGRDMVMELKNKEKAGEKEMLEEANQKKSFLLITGLILSFLIMLVALFVWNNLKRTAKGEKILEELNREIQLRNDDLNTALESLTQIRLENSKITRMVAHDLKNPIGGIRNLVFTFLKKTQTDAVRTSMEQIQTDCNQSISIINDLLKGDADAFKEKKIA
ncbi:MAG: hypothetical protein QM802_21850 [Agriterribacter sp.]